MKALGGVYMMPCKPDELAAQYNDLIVSLKGEAPPAVNAFIETVADIATRNGKEPFYVMAIMIAAIFDRVDSLGGASLVGPTLMFAQHMGDVPRDAEAVPPESERN
jgi:hypothetical protein